MSGARGDHLVGVVRSLAASRTVDDVARIVRRAARSLTGADGATFVLREGDCCHYVDEDAISPLWKGRRFPLSTCISGWAMLNRKAAVIEDIYSDDRIPYDVYRPTFVQSLVMVPIRTADPFGAIGTYWAQRHRPTEDELALLQALADSTAVAMENVRLLADLESRVEQRTAQLRATYEDLRRFTAALAHDVRQPLTTIQGFADLLVTRYTDELSDSARNAVVALDRAATNLGRFVEDVLRYSSTGQAPLLWGPVSVGELVAEVCERLHQQIEDRGATVRADGDDEICGDRGLLSQAIQNLVGNAIAYTPTDRAPQVTVSARREGSSFELSVADNGNGVPEAEREAIFEPFRRGTTSNGRRGSGLGLALCHKVAERHGGSIEVRASRDGGAAFVLVLPARAPSDEVGANVA